MKKLFILVITLASISSFGFKKYSEPEFKDFEFKALIHGGYDFKSGKGHIALDGAGYKTFYVPHINTLFNVGVGAEFGNSFNTSKYSASFIPYVTTEIAGYVHEDLRLYGGIDLGLGYGIDEKFLIGKAGGYVGITYDERFTAELGAKYPGILTLGLGARFGYSPKPKIVEKIVEKEVEKVVEKEVVKEVVKEVIVEKPVEKKIVVSCFSTEKKCVIHGFAVDGRIPNEEEKLNIGEIAQLINTFAVSGTVDVTGHTDSTHTDEYNQKLSVQRAQMVSKLLRLYGLNKTIVFTKITGKGESAPIDTNETKEGRYNNRRVELKFRQLKIK